ncbi:MAG: acyl-CoA dehydrogenase family protein [Pseudomonadota bacterium]
MSELAELFDDTATRIFDDHDTAVVSTIPNTNSPQALSWPNGLWNDVQAQGLTHALVPERMGGAGAEWGDCFRVLQAAGRAAAPIPLGETMFALGTLATRTEDLPSGAISIGVGQSLTLDRQGTEWRVTGAVSRVPWGRHATAVLTQTRHDGQTYLLVLNPADGELAGELNLAREPRDTLNFEAAATIALPVGNDIDDDYIFRHGALLRVAQATGAIASVQSRALAYASDRVQFGRALAKFQTIQHYLADLACHCAQSDVAAGAAFRATDRGDNAFEVASAKVVVGQATEFATRIGHQIHGAMGFTAEHDLHLFTQRLWSWKAEFGSVAHWAERLGRAALARGADHLWSDITDRQAEQH